MVQEILSPRMEHGEEADLRPEVFGIGCNPPQCLARRTEQEVIDTSLILQGDGGDPLRHGKDDVKVVDR